MEGSVEYLLVLSFAPGGSLTDFLQTHTIDWSTFCKMSLSIVKGLAYLHTDIRKGGTYGTTCLDHLTTIIPFDCTFNILCFLFNRKNAIGKQYNLR